MAWIGRRLAHGRGEWNGAAAATNLRRLFLTGGHVGLMGLAPIVVINARPGDAVAIIEGAFVPIVLRKAKGLGIVLDKAKTRGTR